MPIEQVPETWASLADLKILDGQTPSRSDWNVWITGSSFIYRHDDGYVVEVQKGFMTDFASIPRFFRWLWGPSDGPHRLAGIAHDYLYSSVEDMTRRRADQLFKHVSKASSSSKFSYTAMYIALRLGGFMAWRSNRKNLAEKGPRWRFLD